MTFEDILAGLRPHIRRMVRESLQEILLSTDDGDLVTPKIAAKKLGYSDPDSLYKDITEGLLRPGLEVFDRRKPGAQTPRWVVDVKACRDRFAEDPELRV
ncbi:MAG: hypothetical protein ACR2FS_07730 [Phormidesmis sp.]